MNTSLIQGGGYVKFVVVTKPRSYTVIPSGKKMQHSYSRKRILRIPFVHLQTKALILKLSEEKKSAIQQNNKLQQELVRDLIYKFILLVSLSVFYQNFCNFSVISNLRLELFMFFFFFFFCPLSPVKRFKVSQELSFIPLMIREGLKIILLERAEI